MLELRCACYTHDGVVPYQELAMDPVTALFHGIKRRSHGCKSRRLP